MRKFFGGTIVVSLMAAGLVGAALAWTGSITDGVDDGATAGYVCVTLYNQETVANPVVPNGGFTEVMNGGLENCGDVAVHVKSGVDAGSVSTISYDSGCGGADNTIGRVVRISGATVPVDTDVDDLWRVDLAADGDLEDACQGDTIDFTVTVNVTT